MAGDPSADPNNDGPTPVYWATTRSPDLVKLLTALGANVNVQTRDGTTPLMKAASLTNAVETVKFLVTVGAGVDTKRKDGATALSIAVEENNSEAVRFLLDSGASTQAEDSKGRSLLVAAASEGDTATFKLLLKKTTDPALRILALMSASYYGHVAIGKLLVEAGVDLNTKDNKGNSAVMYAASTGQDDMVKWLIQAGAKDRPPGYSAKGEPLSAKDLTKAEWKAKLARKVSTYAATGKVIQIYEKDFVRSFGTPIRTQTIGNSTYWYYKCKDGTIQLVLHAGNLAAGVMQGDVNDF